MPKKELHRGVVGLRVAYQEGRSRKQVEWSSNQQANFAVAVIREEIATLPVGMGFFDSVVEVEGKAGREELPLKPGVRSARSTVRKDAERGDLCVQGGVSQRTVKSGEKGTKAKEEQKCKVVRSRMARVGNRAKKEYRRMETGERMQKMSTDEQR